MRRTFSPLTTAYPARRETGGAEARTTLGQSDAESRYVLHVISPGPTLQGNAPTLAAFQRAADQYRGSTFSWLRSEWAKCCRALLVLLAATVIGCAREVTPSWRA